MHIPSLLSATTGLEKDGVHEQKHDSVLGLTAKIALDLCLSLQSGFCMHFTLNSWLLQYSSRRCDHKYRYASPD